jgi:hypothetical protein
VGFNDHALEAPGVDPHRYRLGEAFERTRAPTVPDSR